MLPAVLACYEYWFGKRRWKPLVPFFLVSLSFGLQGLLMSRSQNNDYTFRFTLPALVQTSRYYASRVFLVPYAGFAIFAAALLAPNRRTWLGLAMLTIFFLPLLFLPGRMFSAYCYLPFTGLAIALTGLPAVARPIWLAIFFLAWLPGDYRELRARRSETLACDADIRAWMTAAGQFIRSHPPPDAWIFSGAPEGFQQWGIEGTLKYFLNTAQIDVRSIDAPEKPPAGAKVAVLNWDQATGRLSISMP
jgi:hypothetical protein